MYTTRNRVTGNEMRGMGEMLNSGECRQVFGGMSPNVPGNVAKHSGKCPQLLEPTSENIELVSKNIQNTNALRLPGNVNEIHKNRNVLKNTGSKRPPVAINKHPEGNRFFAASYRSWYQII